MEINGASATSATTPNARVIVCPAASTPQAPFAIGRTNEETIAPLATPPESNAIPVNIEGQKIIRIKAAAYPISNTHITLNPAIIRKKLSATANDTPAQSPRFIAFAVIAPALACSTSLFRTYTAGSAATMK